MDVRKPVIADWGCASRMSLIAASDKRIFTWRLERRVGRFYVAFRMRREVEIVNKLGLQEALNELEALLLRFRDEEGGAQGN